MTIAPITDPYMPQAQDVLTKTHRQRVYAKVTVGATTTEVEISDGSVALSEDWSPHQRFSITSPATAELLAQADPRVPTRVEVWAGYVYPGEGIEDVQLLATGHARTSADDSPGDALAIECLSDEMRILDHKWMGTRQTKSFAGVVEAVTWILGQAAPTAQTLVADIGASYRPDLTAAVALEPGQSLWDQLAAITLAAGLWPYVDSTGTWRLEPRAQAAGEAAAVLREGPATTIKKTSHSRDIDPYYTAAILTYKWKDSGGADREIFGRWAPGDGSGKGQKVFSATREVQTDQFSADEAARLTVQTLSTRGDAYTVEAMAAYWIRPGHTVSVGPEGLRRIVKTVTFDLGQGTMTITTREPSNLGDN